MTSKSSQCAGYAKRVACARDIKNMYAKKSLSCKGAKNPLSWAPCLSGKARYTGTLR